MSSERLSGNAVVTRVLWALVLTLSLTACSGGDDSSVSDAPTVDLLNAGDTAEVFEGDKLEKTTDEARIEVLHEEASNRKFVTVLTGTAELLRGDYYNNR